MISNKVQELLICPNCKSRDIALKEDEKYWLECNSCQSKFLKLMDIPFLCHNDVLKVVENEHKSDIQEFDKLSKLDVVQANMLFHDKFANKYEQDHSTYVFYDPEGPAQRRINDTLKRISEKTSRGICVDVCCGTGNVLRTAVKHFDTCLGIDISAGMMKLSKERGFEVIGGEATNLPIADSSVDCVTIFSALHHIQNYPEALKEASRILKPNGVLYTDWDPNGHALERGWASKLAVGFEKWRRKKVSTENIPQDSLWDAAEYHVNSKTGFEGETVKKTLQENGFSDIKIFYHGNPASFYQRDTWGFYGWANAILKTMSFIPPTSKNVGHLVAVIAHK